MRAEMRCGVECVQQSRSLCQFTVSVRTVSVRLSVLLAAAASCLLRLLPVCVCECVVLSHCGRLWHCGFACLLVGLFL